MTINVIADDNSSNDQPLQANVHEAMPGPKEKPEVEPEKMPNEDPGITPTTDPDEDEDDDDPLHEIEIGDDPEEEKKKIPIM